MFVRVAKKNKQTAHNTTHDDDEVEEDEETESFAALEGEALVITSPYGIFYLLAKIIHQLQEEESDLPAEHNLRKHAVQQQKSLQENLLERLFLPKHLVSHHSQFRKDTMH